MTSTAASTAGLIGLVAIATCTLLAAPAMRSLEAAGTQSADQPVTVAEVRGKRITSTDIQDELTSQRKRDATAGRFDAFTSTAKARVLNQIVDVKLLATAARDRKLDRDPDVRRRLDNLIDESLAAVLITKIAEATTASPESLKKYFDAHPTEFSNPPRVSARHIVVKSEAEAEAALAQLRAGGDFAQIARAANIDSTKDSGGDLGWVAPGIMVPAFEQVLFSLKAGEISAVVHTTFGFHVVQVQEIESPKPRPFEQVTDLVRQKLLVARIDALKTELRAKYPVKIDTRALEMIGR